MVSRSGYWENGCACWVMTWQCVFSVDAVPTRDLWSGVPQYYIGLLSEWYCSLGQCCESGDCRITNNITGMSLFVCNTMFSNTGPRLDWFDSDWFPNSIVLCKTWCLFLLCAGLAQDMQQKLHGQHLAQSVVLKAVQGFINNPESNKPLTLSFHGWSGTGKNFVARIIADNLYRDGVKSECVRLFIAPFHFPHARLVETYKVRLKPAGTRST